MVGAADGIETGVVPVSAVPEPPRRHPRVHVVDGFLAAGAGEGLIVELLPLRLREIGALRIGCDLVEPRFVVVVSKQIGLCR